MAGSKVCISGETSSIESVAGETTHLTEARESEEGSESEDSAEYSLPPKQST